MSTPQALQRFQKSMVSKKADQHCAFCGVETTPGTDFAFLDNGKWFAVCALHASSTVEQCKALLLTLQTEAKAFGLDGTAMAQVNAHAPQNITAVLAGEADEYDTVAAAIKLADALGVVRTFKPADPVIGRIRDLLAGTKATAWERDFATSILRQVEDGRELSGKQQATLTRVLDGQSQPVASVDACKPVDGGVYVVEGTYYLVHESKAGNLYAMILASAPVKGSKLDWQYNPGGIKTIRRSGRAITAAEAAALGHSTSYCCFCSRELKDEGEGRSVEVGYGPVCGPKHGLPWG